MPLKETKIQLRAARKQRSNTKDQEVNKKYNTTLSGQTIMRYVANGLIGVSPLKMGPDGGVPDDHFRLLCTAVWESSACNTAEAGQEIGSHSAPFLRVHGGISGC